MDALTSGGCADRVPVGFCIVARYFARALGADYDEFVRDPETHYAMSLAFLKFHAEKIRDDFLTGPVLSVSPFFDNVVNASAFGARVVRPRGETPRALPVIHFVEEMAAMKVPGRIEAAPLTIGGEGPHMIAIDLVGTDFYWWQVEYPEECRAFLSKITDGMIAAERHFRLIDPRPRGSYGLAEDSAQAMSAEMFRDFCIPYDERLYKAFGEGLADGRGMHMCGRSMHLHPALTEDLRISSFNVFGHLVEPEVAAANLGGKCRLWGNVDPLLLLNGSAAEVGAAAGRCLRAMAPFGGFTLGDGANVCPGTPLENLEAVIAAAERYGSPAMRAKGRQ